MATPVADPAHSPATLSGNCDQRSTPAVHSSVTWAAATSSGPAPQATTTSHSTSRWVGSRGSIRTSRSSTSAAPA